LIEYAFDLLRVAAELLHRIAHGCKIDNRRNPGKVLHQDARRHKRYLSRGLGLCLPIREKLNVVRGDALAIFLPQQVLQQNAQAVRKTMEGEALGLKRLEAENLVVLVADLEGGLAAEAVHWYFLSKEHAPLRKIAHARA